MMDGHSYSIRSTRIVADGTVRPGVVHVRGEKIERVEFEGEGARLGEPGYPEREGHRHIDVGDLVVMPGLVDTHVHVNEPGRTDWEGFVTAGRAAAAGGITTIVVMPLNCTPAATNVAALMGEAEAAAGKCLVDYGFWGGVVPGNVKDLEPMWKAGALGFKCFMVDSGVEDFHGSSMHVIRDAASLLAQLGVPLLVHAEDPEVLARAAVESGLAQNPSSYAAYLASRPPESEAEAITNLFVLLSEEPRLRLHIVHLACGKPGALLPLAQSMNYAMTGETCPHYLTFASEAIPDGATAYKCAPPIRERHERESLWRRLKQGYLTMVVSDHSPCPPGLKRLERGDFMKAWGGISSLQLGLSATWTGARDRKCSTADVARWMCENPAKLAGINGQKGRIEEGMDADLIFFDPDAEWTVRAESLQHRHKLTPYDGMKLRGVVKRTILRGRTIYDAAASNPFPLEPIGQWIKRDRT